MSRENSGKREHQKIKPYIVLEYLMRNSDEQHAIPASDIVNYLQEDCGIDAERRSVYRDIDEINRESSGRMEAFIQSISDSR